MPYSLTTAIFKFSDRKFLCCAALLLATFSLSSHAAAESNPAKPKPASQADIDGCLATGSDDISGQIKLCDTVLDAEATGYVNEQARHQRGRLLAKRGNTARALQDYDALLQASPSNADALVERAALHHARGNHPLALQDYTKALKIDPTHQEAKRARRALVLELERIGAFMGTGKKPPP